MDSEQAQKPCLLVVEDDERNRLLFERFFSAHGYAVFSVASAADAFSHLEQELVDLIILDYWLPDSIAPLVCQQLRQEENTKQILIMVISAAAEPSMQRKSINAGANAFYHKPFDIDALLLAVEELISPSSSGNRLAQGTRSGPEID